jgi:competence protein ComEA
MKHLMGVVLLVLMFLTGAAWAAPVNINTAEAPALMAAIKGVGEKKAQAIVQYRKQHGPFKSVDELANVPGIGEKTVEKNRNNLTIGKSGGAAETKPASVTNQAAQ